MSLSESTLVTRTDREGVALLVIDHPPVNAASQQVRAELKRHIEDIGADASVGAVVLACAGRTFTAGADIREFGKPPTSPILYEVCAAIEACPKPVVAAVHGTALGGGLELALASHARIAARDAKIGLPEVKLGLVPGAGGTQRTPRLAGLLAAIDIASSGRLVSAEEAQRLGLVDALVAPDALREAALAEARRLAGSVPRRTGALPVPPVAQADIDAALAAVKKKARGQNAPMEAANLVLRAATLPVEDGVLLEREAFMRLMETDQGRALRHVFFAEREVTKVPGLEGARAADVKMVGVAGAGLMGSGIAVALLEAGFSVIAVEQSAEAAERGRARIAGMVERARDQGRIDAATCAARLARLNVTDDFAGFAPCDLVIEAVFDDLAVKQALFQKLSAIVRPDAILATNTSYLDPNEIAASATNPERVVGMHFFSPANIMRLLEVVRCAKTTSDVLATALAVGKKLRKVCVVSGVCQGFIGNRIYSIYRKQIEYMLEEGALPAEIDAALESFGLAMGPFKVFDLSGLEIAWALRKRLAPTRDPRERYVPIADRLCEMGRFGQKTAAGWYKYDSGKPVVDPLVTDIVREEAQKSARLQRHFTPEEIRIRVISAMINEGCKVLEEGIALRAADIDLVFLNGYGWPAHLGGPMFCAELWGWDRVLAEVRAMEARDGLGWTPAKLLVEKAGRTIAESRVPG